MRSSILYIGWMFNTMLSLSYALDFSNDDQVYQLRPRYVANYRALLPRTTPTRSSSRSAPRMSDRDKNGSPRSANPPQSPTTSKASASVRLDLRGDGIKPYMKTPATNHAVPQEGGSLTHPQQILAGAKIHDLPQHRDGSHSAMMVVKGDKVKAQIKAGHGSNLAQMVVSHPWGGPDRRISVKPGDTHTHVTSNGGQGESSRIMLGLNGPGAIHGSAANIHRVSRE